ncbi:MAG TPA: hypothetical protein VFN97_02010, partial [Actinospica sp.]|nr:hypothetical protein [Actinospica sp.]
MPQLKETTHTMLSIRINQTARAATALTFGAALALAGVAQATAATPTTTASATHAHAAYKAECAAHVAGHMHCDAYVRTDVKRHTQARGVHAAASSVSGYGPTDLQSAYNL